MFVLRFQIYHGSMATRWQVFWASTALQLCSLPYVDLFRLQQNYCLLVFCFYSYKKVDKLVASSPLKYILEHPTQDENVFGRLLWMYCSLFIFFMNLINVISYHDFTQGNLNPALFHHTWLSNIVIIISSINVGTRAGSPEKGNPKLKCHNLGGTPNPNSRKMRICRRKPE